MVEYLVEAIHFLPKQPTPLTQHHRQHLRGLLVSAAITNIFIECDNPTYTQGHGHDRTVVYGAQWPSGDTEPTFSAAVPLCHFQGTVASYATNPNTRWCIWIKWESIDGFLSSSPAGGTNGAQVTTGQDVTSLVQAMTGVGNPFTILPMTTVIDGVTFPAGTYSTNAFIIDNQVINSKIANLAVDDAKMANVSVAKLLAGTLSVGRYIQSSGYVAGTSGWKIHANGTAEFGSASIRGQIIASQIDGSGLVIRKADGTPILGVGTALTSDLITPAPGWLNSALTPIITNAQNGR